MLRSTGAKPAARSFRIRRRRPRHFAQCIPRHIGQSARAASITVSNPPGHDDCAAYAPASGWPGSAHPGAWRRGQLSCRSELGLFQSLWCRLDDRAGRQKQGHQFRLLRTTHQLCAPPDPIDVVVLNNVIEHVRDPHSLLTRYRGYLRTQGSIVIFTPNAQALSHAAFRRYWSGLHSPWHVQVLTRKSLAVLAGQAGFQISKMTADEDPGGWAISFQNWWRNFWRGAGHSTGSGFGVMTALALVCFAPVALFALVIGHGSSLLAILRPGTAPEGTQAGIVRLN